MEADNADPPFDRELGKLPSEVRALVHFVSCDTDAPENEGVVNLFSMVTVPALGLFVNGRPTDIIVGLRAAESLAIELVNRFPLPVTITVSEPRATGRGLAGIVDWIRTKFRPREKGRTCPL